MIRFDGTCEKLCDLDVSGLISWAAAIPLEEWPSVAGSMRTLEWRDAATAIEPYVPRILAHFPGGRDSLHYFSMVRPAHKIAAHKDEQAEAWVCRIHIPIITNPAAAIVIDGETRHLPAGAAYKINTLKDHSIYNNGSAPRIHWMFDVLAGA